MMNAEEVREINEALGELWASADNHMKWYSRAIDRLRAGDDPETVIRDEQVSKLGVLFIWRRSSRRHADETHEAHQLRIRRCHPVFAPIILDMFAPVFPKT